MYWICGWLINNLFLFYWYMNYMLFSEELFKIVINSYLFGILEVLALINRFVIAVMDYCRVINLLLVRKSLFYREVLCLYGYFEKYYVYCFNNIYKIFILYKLIWKWLCCKILIFLIYYCFLGLKMGFFVVILNF